MSGDWFNSLTGSLPADTKVIGYNDQGLPILYSSSSNAGLEFIVIDFKL